LEPENRTRRWFETNNRLVRNTGANCWSQIGAVI
jgi:hypothetical protein